MSFLNHCRRALSFYAPLLSESLPSLLVSRSSLLCRSRRTTKKKKNMKCLSSSSVADKREGDDGPPRRCGGGVVVVPREKEGRPLLLPNRLLPRIYQSAPKSGPCHTAAFSAGWAGRGQKTASWMGLDKCDDRCLCLTQSPLISKHASSTYRTRKQNDSYLRGAGAAPLVWLIRFALPWSAGEGPPLLSSDLRLGVQVSGEHRGGKKQGAGAMMHAQPRVDW